jgi:hypothetical protein
MKKLFFVLTFSFLGSFLMKGQSCGTCSINITGLDSSSYTLSGGQTLCIDSTGVFKGLITVNGGTICNNGVFLPKVLTFNSGLINNNSTATIKSATSLGNGQTINNQPGAILGVSGNLSLSGGILNNDGILNISGNINNSSGSFSNSSIINCILLTGTNTMSNTGVINTN